MIHDDIAVFLYNNPHATIDEVNEVYKKSCEGITIEKYMIDIKDRIINCKTNVERYVFISELMKYLNLYNSYKRKPNQMVAALRRIWGWGR